MVLWWRCFGGNGRACMAKKNIEIKRKTRRRKWHGFSCLAMTLYDE
uniref:Uncharacterized protein n=1 Tax=Rhizophora mucronata TaxID=61149 RepID=A0A2P2NAS3_RHIMU